jgi:hypothetical protein
MTLKVLYAGSDEFCYKVNRRYFGEELFDRLLIACLTINYKEIINDSR